MNFLNKVVLITGASAGIGAATAIQYSKLSAKLALVGRNEENLKKVADECEKSEGIKPLIIVADVSVVDDLKRIVDETVEHFGGIDILINNAGANKFDSIRDIKLEVFNFNFETNLRSVYVLTHHALPHLIKSKGNIVNVSSICADTAYKNFLSYSMAKAALDQLTRIVAYDLGPDGVRVNSVKPGLTVSTILDRMGFDEEAKAKFVAMSLADYPLNRIAESEHIADSILYLSSDLAKNITGITLTSDGGRSLNGAQK